MNIRIKKLRESARLPEYKTDFSAAADLYACLDGPLTIPAGGRVGIPLGFAMEYEDNDVVAVICARSGLASKRGLALSNGIGVVDPDYRGELTAAMINLSDSDYTVYPGDRIAQLMFLPIVRGSFEEAEELSETKRGEGGFGSTGV
jgi:dUTP pyrophosphatase